MIELLSPKDSSSRDRRSYRAVIFSVCLALMTRSFQTDGSFVARLSYHNLPKIQLEEYAARQGFTNILHYTDDGWSGGNFDRPSWKRLIADIIA